MFEETERALSRFLAESELSALNRSAGRPFRASPLLLQAVTAALAAARETDGLFDPTVLNALLEAGYDRSFELLNDGVEESGLQESGSRIREGADNVLIPESGRLGGSLALPVPLSPRPPVPPSPRLPASPPLTHQYSWRDVVVDLGSGTITLPPNTGLDLGGIGKGWTVDRATNALRRFNNFVVDAGGDIYAAGTQDNGMPWTVGIEDPVDNSRDIAALAIHDQAIVTSTTRRRRWLLHGREQHHLIDPRTGRCADTGVLSVTVVAGAVARAETLAKAALLLGPRESAWFLEKHGAQGILVLDGGQVKLTSSLQKESQHAS